MSTREKLQHTNHKTHTLQFELQVLDPERTQKASMDLRATQICSVFLTQEWLSATRKGNFPRVTRKAGRPAMQIKTAFV